MFWICTFLTTCRCDVASASKTLQQMSEENPVKFLFHCPCLCLVSGEDEKERHLLKMKEGIPRCILCVMLGNISMVTVKAVTLVKLPESISVDQFPTVKDMRWRAASKMVLIYTCLRINGFWEKFVRGPLHKQENVMMSVYSWRLRVYGSSK